MKKILACIRNADQQFNLINEGDKIAVGLSGGKDSLMLLFALNIYRRFSKNSFDVCAITLGMDLPNCQQEKLRNFCEKINVDFHFVPTDIKEVVFDIRKEKNPCSLCAKMRRGTLNDFAKQKGCNVVALGHHREDVLETMMLSLFFESRLNVFAPKQFLTRVGLNIIRPMIYVDEKHIIKLSKKLKLPIVENPCIANGYTKRQDMKELLKSFDSIIDGQDASARMMRALSQTQSYQLWDKQF